MLQKIRGRVVRVATDDINTDVISPTEYRLAVPDDEKNLTILRPHVMDTVRPGLDQYVRPGDVFVVGKNFGCGSHRETAVQIFKVWGVQAVVTETAGRIWFRNAVAAGLPVFELEDATKYFGESDEIEINMQDWHIRNATKSSKPYPIAPFPPTVMIILEVGGIMPLLVKRFRAETSDARAPT